MPNLPVDVDSWGRSACYPRSTFYLMINGPSTRDRWVTKPYFRTCSTYRSRSQALLYLYALRTIANRTESTFGLLRYLLGGTRPRQTAHLTMSFAQIHGTKLGFQCWKGGISLMTPLELTPKSQSLPPMLHSRHKNSISGYSKGSRGLSVLPRVSGIFTTTTISPSLSLRQSPSR